MSKLGVILQSEFYASVRTKIDEILAGKSKIVLAKIF